jgi:hypothetical protein
MSGAGNSKVGLWNPETDAESMNDDGSIKVAIVAGGVPVGIATEATLADIKTNQTSGNQKTIVVDGGGINAVDFATQTTLGEMKVIQTDSSQVTKISDVNGSIFNPATEATLALIKAQTDKMTFDASGHLAVDLESGLNYSLFDTLYATEYGATYNYIMKYDHDKKWVIQRETVATGVRDYAKGETTISTAWTGRAGQTYGDLGL